jgi:PAS domain S-box-containing protein
MYKLIYVLLFIFVSAQLQGQVLDKYLVDSMETQIRNSEGSEKTNLLIKLTTHYLTKSAFKGFTYAKMAMQEAHESGSDSSIAKAQLNMGTCSIFIGDYQKAIPFYDSALQYYINNFDTLGQINTLLLYGKVMSSTHRISRSFEYYLQGLNLAENIKAKKWICIFNEEIGNIYRVIGDYENASVFFQKSYKTAEASKNQKLIASAYQNMGVFYLKTGRYIEAIESLNQALYLYQLNHSKEEIITAFKNMGDYYINMKNYRIALNNYQKSLQACIEVDDQHRMGTIYTKIAHSYQLLGDKAKTLEYNRKALKSRKEYGNLALTSSSLINLATSFIELNKYDSALMYLKAGQKLAMEINSVLYLRGSHLKLYLLESKQGKFEEALNNYRKYIEFRDLITAKEKNKEITKLKARYDIHDKETELQLQQLQLEKKQSQNILMGLVITLILVFAGFLYYLYRSKKKASEQYIQLNLVLEEKFEQRSKELKEKENQFQNLVEQIPMGVYRSTLEGDIAFANNALIKMLSYNSMLELQNSRQIKSKFFLAHRKRFIEQIRKKGEVKNLESIWQRADGQFIDISEYARAIMGDDGEIQYFEGVVEDITVRKKDESILKDALEKANDSDRLKTAFLSTMQHELRTPLNGILGFSEILKDDEGIKEDAREFIELIHESGQHLLNIINDILDISTLTAGTIKISPKKCNINNCIDEIEKEILSNNQDAIENKKIRFKTIKGLPDNEAFVVVDLKRLKQILWNLLDNAFKFTYEGEIILNYEANERLGLIFTVQDSGIGIPSNKMEIIFEQFRQVEETDTRQYGGNGLGLAICKNLLKYMGGEIWVESTPNKGSSFSFNIPAISGKKTEVVPTKKPQIKKEIKWQNIRILIAEDNFPNYLLIETYLKKTGIRLYHAKNGEEAIDIFRETGEFDIILMDIQLPGISGYEACREIIKINKNAKIMAITAYATEADKDKCFAAGCVDYITKPVIKNIFLSKIERLLS